MEEIWRGAVTRQLRHSYDLFMGHIRDKKQWQRYLQAQYGRRWKFHFAKKTRGAWRSVKYLGRYVKRPPVSAAKEAQALQLWRGGAQLFGDSNCQKCMKPWRWKRGKSRSSPASLH